MIRFEVKHHVDKFLAVLRRLSILTRNTIPAQILDRKDSIDRESCDSTLLIYNSFAMANYGHSDPWAYYKYDEGGEQVLNRYFPRKLYRVYDDTSQSKWIRGDWNRSDYTKKEWSNINRFCAGDTDYENTYLKYDKDYELEYSKILYRWLDLYLEWENTIPTPFFSAYANRNSALAALKDKENDGRITGSSVAVIDVNALARYKIGVLNVRKAAKAFRYLIPEKAWDNSRYEYICHRRIHVDAAVAQFETSEEFLEYFKIEDRNEGRQW
ncbi:hypothetical protein RUND412_003793 [Rhizina undulata]